VTDAKIDFIADALAEGFAEAAAKKAQKRDPEFLQKIEQEMYGMALRVHGGIRLVSQRLDRKKDFLWIPSPDFHHGAKDPAPMRVEFAVCLCSEVEKNSNPRYRISIEPQERATGYRFTLDSSEKMDGKFKTLAVANNAQAIVAAFARDCALQGWAKPDAPRRRP
jgi:hypothetical protein